MPFLVLPVSVLFHENLSLPLHSIRSAILIWLQLFPSLLPISSLLPFHDYRIPAILLRWFLLVPFCLLLVKLRVQALFLH